MSLKDADLPDAEKPVIRIKFEFIKYPYQRGERACIRPI